MRYPRQLCHSLITILCLAFAVAAGTRVALAQGSTPTVSYLDFSGSPASDNTYQRGDSIGVWVGFTENMAVSGIPQLALTIGANTRLALYTGLNSDRTFLYFSYTVQMGDLDNDGISIGAAALQLNGGTIQDTGGTNANLSLGGYAITDNASHKVDDSPASPVVVTGVSFFGNPKSGDTYERGERIEVRIDFDKQVDLTGTPQLTLTIGTQTRLARYGSHNAEQTALIFGYRIRAGDRDANGISIGADALRLNGGTIRGAGEGADANLSLGGFTITDDPSHKVDFRITSPRAPTGLTATADGPTAIDLAWTAPAPNVRRAAVTSYRIEWSTDGKAPWHATHVTPDVTTYQHSPLPAKTIRYYRVISLSDSGDSPPSNTASATTDREALRVAFNSASYLGIEGGGPVVIAVTTNRPLEQAITIPITVTPQGATQAEDYTVEGLIDGTMTLSRRAISRTFHITANHDADDDDETVELSFGTLPEGVMAGETATAVVTIEDRNLAELSVAFDAASYRAAEGGEPVTLRVTLDPPADRKVTIPITVTPQGATQADDYTVAGLTDGTMTFAVGEDSQTFTLAANHDVDSDDETVELSFGTLPVAVKRRQAGDGRRHDRGPGGTDGKLCAGRIHARRRRRAGQHRREHLPGSGPAGGSAAAGATARRRDERGLRRGAGVDRLRGRRDRGQLPGGRAGRRGE